jgi:hypothetical protein
MPLVRFHNETPLTLVLRVGATASQVTAGQNGSVAVTSGDRVTVDNNFGIRPAHWSYEAGRTDLWIVEAEDGEGYEIKYEEELGGPARRA